MTNKFIYNVELLEGDRKNAHIHMNDLDQPTIWSQSSKHFKEHSEYYTIMGYTFVEGCISYLRQSALSITLRQFAEWAQYNCPQTHSWGQNLFGLNTSITFKFVELPDGTWLIQLDKVGWVAIDSMNGTWESKPKKIRENGHERLDSNYKVLLDRDERITKLQQIIDGFYPSWKKARHIYRNSLRESGEFQERLEQARSTRDVAWMEQRMQLGAAIADLRNELDELTRHLEDDTLTKANLSATSKAIEEYTLISRDTSKQFASRLKSKKRKKHRR